MSSHLAGNPSPDPNDKKPEGLINKTNTTQNPNLDNDDIVEIPLSTPSIAHQRDSLTEDQPLDFHSAIPPLKKRRQDDDSQPSSPRRQKNDPIKMDDSSDVVILDDNMSDKASVGSIGSTGNMLAMDDVEEVALPARPRAAGEPIEISSDDKEDEEEIDELVDDEDSNSNPKSNPTPSPIPQSRPPSSNNRGARLPPPLRNPTPDQQNRSSRGRSLSLSSTSSKSPSPQPGPATLTETIDVEAVRNQLPHYINNLYAKIQIFPPDFTTKMTMEAILTAVSQVNNELVRVLTAMEMVGYESAGQVWDALVLQYLKSVLTPILKHFSSQDELISDDIPPVFDLFYEVAHITFLAIPFLDAPLLPQSTSTEALPQASSSSSQQQQQQQEQQLHPAHSVHTLSIKSLPADVAQRARQCAIALTRLTSLILDYSNGFWAQHAMMELVRKNQTSGQFHTNQDLTEEPCQEYLVFLRDQLCGPPISADERILSYFNSLVEHSQAPLSRMHEVFRFATNALNHMDESDVFLDRFLDILDVHLKRLPAPPEDFKHEDKRGLVEFCRNFYSFATSVSDQILEEMDQAPGDWVEMEDGVTKALFDLANRMLRADILEKRLCGLNMFKDQFKRLEEHWDYFEKRRRKAMQKAERTVAFQGKKAVEKVARAAIRIIKKHQVLEYLFGTNCHLELISRSVELLEPIALYRELELEDLDIVWLPVENNQHQSIIHSVFNVISRICTEFEAKIHGRLIEKLEKMNVGHVDAQTCSMIETCMVAASKSSDSGNDDDKKQYGDKLENYIQFLLSKLEIKEHDEGSANAGEWDAGLLTKTFDMLQKLSSRLRVDKQYEFVSLLLTLLSKHNYEPQLLSLLTHIVATNFQNPETTNFFVDLLQKSKFPQLFLMDSQHYKAKCKLALQEHPDRYAADKTPIYNMTFYGKMSHYVHVYTRLGILTVLSRQAHALVSADLICGIFDVFVKDAISDEEKNLAFDQLCHLGLPLNDLVDTRLQLLDIPHLSQSGFKFVENCLNSRNFFHRRCEYRPTASVGSTADYAFFFTQEPFGDDLLWKIALEAHSDDVGQLAKAALVNQVLYITEELAPRKRGKFIDMCVTTLLEASKTDASQVHDRKRFSRSLEMLETFLNRFNAKYPKSSRPSLAPPHSMLMVAPTEIAITIRGTFETMQISLMDTDTIGKLRTEIAKRLSCVASRVRMFITGKEIDSEALTLKTANLTNGANILVQLRPEIVNVSGEDEVEQPEQKHEEDKLTAAIIEADSATETQDVQMKEREEEAIGPQPVDAVMADAQVSAENSDFIDPFAVLSSSKYFESLFDILSLDQFYASKIWSLLMMLPTSVAMLDIIRKVDTLSTKDWSSILCRDKPYRMLYALQVIHHFVFNGDDRGNNASEQLSWRQKFLKSFGLHQLLSHVFLLDMDRAMNDAACRGCVALALKIVDSFSVQEIGMSSKGIATDELMSKLVANACIVSSTTGVNVDTNASVNANVPVKSIGMSPSPTQDAESEDSDMVQRAFDIVFKLGAKHLDQLVVVLQKTSFLKTSLLACPDWRIRKAATTSVKVFVDSLFLRLNEENSESDVSALYTAFSTLFSVLFELLNEAAVQFDDNCSEYFDLLNDCLTRAISGLNSWYELGRLQALFLQLVNKLDERQIKETSSLALPDSYLNGVMKLLLTAVRAHDSLKTIDHVGVRLVRNLFFSCLFDIPTSKQLHSSFPPPKCKHDASRNLAFQLLCELARDSKTNYLHLVDLLLKHYGSPEQVTDIWNYSPRDFEKSAVGFVGLKNLGCTCYMNSIMQQFFMVPSFRAAILAANPGDEPQSENLLYQLQVMYGNLQESQKKDFVPYGFCRAYKDYDGNPMNVAVQMDVDEYFNLLFDRLETRLKGSPFETVIKDHFGGKLIQQIKSKECDHISQREESFFNIQCEVKGKRNFEESMAFYVEGELLDGDNKYFCASCGKHVDAVKRTCIKSLPNVLLVHLKRFDFDMETMRRIKINDHFQFPLEVNMEPYTLEYITDRENGKVDVAEKSSQPVMYDLVGVLVHSGTADSGHYYSFIKERSQGRSEKQQWLHFNDSLVETFDVKEMPKQCFGGFDDISHWDDAQKRDLVTHFPRSYNAYMLLYERREMDVDRSLVDERGLAKVPTSIDDEIQKENQSFLTDKSMFDSNYGSLLWDMVHLTNSYGDQSTDIKSRCLRLSLHYFTTVLCRSRDRANFDKWLDFITASLKDVPTGCEWFINLLCQRPSILEKLLLHCWVEDVRNGILKLITTAITHLGDRFYDDSTDTSLIAKFVGMLMSSLPEAYTYWSNFGQFFDLIAYLANLGPRMRHFMVKESVLAKLIDFFLADFSPTADTEAERTKRHMGDRQHRPVFLNVVVAIRNILMGCAPMGSHLNENDVIVGDAELYLLFHEHKPGVILFIIKLCRDVYDAGVIGDIVYQLISTLPMEYGFKIVDTLVAEIVSYKVKNVRFLATHTEVMKRLAISTTETISYACFIRLYNGLNRHILQTDIDTSIPTVFWLLMMAGTMRSYPVDHHLRLYMLSMVEHLFRYFTSQYSEVNLAAQNLFSVLVVDSLKHAELIPDHILVSLKALLVSYVQILMRLCFDAVIASHFDCVGPIYEFLLDLIEIPGLETEFAESALQAMDPILYDTFCCVEHQFEAHKNEDHATLIKFLCLMALRYPIVREQVVRHQNLPTKLIEMTVTLSHNEEDIAFNNRFMPYYYRLLRLCGETSDNYLEMWTTSNGFHWALREMIVGNYQGLQREEVVEELMKTLDVVASKPLIRVNVLKHMASLSPSGQSSSIGLCQILQTILSHDVLPSDIKFFMQSEFCLVRCIHTLLSTPRPSQSSEYFKEVLKTLAMFYEKFALLYRQSPGPAVNSFVAYHQKFFADRQFEQQVFHVLLPNVRVNVAQSVRSSTLIILKSWMVLEKKAVKSLFPVVLEAHTYWRSLMEQFSATSGLTRGEIKRIFGGGPSSLFGTLDIGDAEASKTMIDFSKLLIHVYPELFRAQSRETQRRLRFELYVDYYSFVFAVCEEATRCDVDVGSILRLISLVSLESLEIGMFAPMASWLFYLSSNNCTIDVQPFGDALFGYLEEVATRFADINELNEGNANLEFAFSFWLYLFGKFRLDSRLKSTLQTMLAGSMLPELKAKLSAALTRLIRKRTQVLLGSAREESLTPDQQRQITTKVSELFDVIVFIGQSMNESPDVETRYQFDKELCRELIELMTIAESKFMLKGSSSTASEVSQGSGTEGGSSLAGEMAATPGDQGAMGASGGDVGIEMSLIESLKQFCRVVEGEQGEGGGSV